MSKTKPFDISKRVVWEAYERVKANKGAPGVDDESIEQFEQDLKGNLYKLWNRLSSGSYFPPPVKLVEIPKAGGVRPGGAHGGRPRGTDGGVPVSGAAGGACVPSALVRVPAGPFGAGCGRGLP